MIEGTGIASLALAMTSESSHRAKRRGGLEFIGLFPNKLHFEFQKRCFLGSFARL
jgi:hypothetical protein